MPSTRMAPAWRMQNATVRRITAFNIGIIPAVRADRYLGHRSTNQACALQLPGLILSAGTHSSRRIATRGAYVDDVDRLGHYLVHFHRDGSYPDSERDRALRALLRVGCWRSSLTITASRQTRPRSDFLDGDQFEQAQNASICRELRIVVRRHCASGRANDELSQTFSYGRRSTNAQSAVCIFV
jgi:hypothetical protein